MELVIDFINLITWLILKCILVCKLYTVLLSNLLRSYVNFIAAQQRIFLGKGHVTTCYLSRAILNESFQLTPCRETCMQYVQTRNCVVAHTQMFQILSFWILQLTSVYLINFFWFWIVSARITNIASLSFKWDQFIFHVGVHVCVIHTVHCICKTKKMQNLHQGKRVILVN